MFLRVTTGIAEHTAIERRMKKLPGRCGSSGMGREKKKVAPEPIVPRSVFEEDEFDGEMEAARHFGLL